MEKATQKKQFVKTLQRLINGLTEKQSFTIQIKRKKIRVPLSALLSIEYEEDAKGQELEFQLKWRQQKK